ncbi:hypothetical protein [Streptomyces sp. NPDC001205]
MKQLSQMSEREYFAHVGQRPGMFVGKASFHTLTAFLIGYDQHALRHGGHGLVGWHEWLAAPAAVTATTHGPAKSSASRSRTVGRT